MFSIKLYVIWTILVTALYVQQELFAGEMYPPGWQLNATIASWHYVDHPYAEHGEDWEEFNPGLVLSGRYGSVGVIRNSFGEASFLGGLRVFGYKEGELDLRLDVGAGTGYGDLSYSTGEGIAPIAVGAVSYKRAVLYVLPGAFGAGVNLARW
jgi:hypothetical protein